MPVPPIEFGRHVLDRARKLHTAAEDMTDHATADDLRRMAVALGVAAIDTYFHERVRRVDLGVPRNVPKKLQALEVPLRDLINANEQSILARRKGERDRPRVKTKHVLNAQLTKMTFQSAKGVEHAFNLVGAGSCWTRVAAGLDGATPTAVKHDLNQLSTWRNRIVHEGHVRRQVRPRQIQTDPIKHDDVVAALDWIGKFLDAADAVR